MYLLGFVCFWWLGRMREGVLAWAYAGRRGESALLWGLRRDSGWAPRLLPLLPARLLPRGSRSASWRFGGRHEARRPLGRRHRHDDSRTPSWTHVLADCRLRLAHRPLWGSSSGAHRQLHQRGALGAGGSRTPLGDDLPAGGGGHLRGTPRSSTKRGWRDCCSSSSCGCAPGSPGRPAPSRRSSRWGTGSGASSWSTSEPDAFLGLQALGLSRGQWLTLPSSSWDLVPTSGAASAPERSKQIGPLRSGRPDLIEVFSSAEISYRRTTSCRSPGIRRRL